jgi:hypothetical protein
MALLDKVLRRSRWRFSGKQFLCHRLECDSRNLFVFRRSGNACAASLRSFLVSALPRGDFRDCCRFGRVPALAPPDFARFAALICGWDGTTKTEQGACRTTCSAMLPINTCFKPVSPCVDVMIRSTSRSFAKAQISSTGEPFVKILSNFTAPKFAVRTSSRIWRSAFFRAAFCKAGMS